MTVTAMKWQDLETCVSEAIDRRYQALPDDRQRFEFCRQLGIAYKDLKDTAYENPDYHRPCMGEAYSLKYHLGRTDNICIALSYIHKKHPLKPEMQVLDVGSGTGSGTMAVVYWAACSFSGRSPKLCIDCIEPAQPMREAATYLMEAFLEQLQQTVAGSPAPSPVQWQYLQPANLEQCAGSDMGAKYDLILFSYTFPKQEPSEWQQTTAQVLKIAALLKPGGVLAFLTPGRPLEKKQLMEHLQEALVTRANLQHLPIEIERTYSPRASTRTPRTSYAPQRNPPPVLSLRRQLNEECRRLKLRLAFGTDSEDYPYYGFYGTLEAFSLRHPSLLHRFLQWLRT